MSIILKPIDRVDHIDKDTFITNYLNPQRPMIIHKATETWPALQKWTFDYLKETVGDITVPLYDSSKADPSKKINAAAAEMKFGDYIDLIQKQPTDLRIFLFDPIKYAPKLLEDFRSPTNLMGGFLDKYPNMFFGGAGSVTFLHFDIDLAHIFHTHFNGRKHVILFEQKWSDRDIEHPDFKNFPALNGIEGQQAILEHGDTLFMPTGYWHWIKYLDGSFSISLRAWDKSWAIKTKSLYNLTIQRKFDDLMKNRFKQRYMGWKEELAIKRANKAIAQNKPT